MTKWSGRLGTAAISVAILAGAPARAAWFEARSDHFRVYAEGSARAAEALAADLERFDHGMRALRGLPDKPADRVNPLDVYVVPGLSAIRRLCGQSRRDSCANVAGFYDGGVFNSSAFTPAEVGGGDRFALDPRTVLFHEYTHHLMFENFAAAYPLWFSEGFAEFSSTAKIGKDGAISFGEPAYHRLYGLVATPALPIAKLLETNGRKLADTDMESLYGRGWLLTHYLSMDEGRRLQLAAYLRDFAAGVPSRKAAERAFGDLGKLDRSLDAYLHRGKLGYVTLRPWALPAGSVTVRALTAGENATMPARLRSKRGVDAGSAASVLAEARRAGAPYPDDPGAQDALAEAEFDAGNDDAAEAAADRALKTRPGDVVAMMYKGRSELRRAAKAKRGDAAWNAGRAWLVRANRAEPDLAAPLYLYYQSYVDQGVRAPEIAARGLEKALALVPQDGSVRFLYARRLIDDGDAGQARAVLAPLAYDPHADAANPAGRVIAMIDEGKDAAAIRAALDGAQRETAAPK